MEQALSLSFIYDLPQQFPLWGTVLFALFIVWSFLWKGLALWHSAQRGQHWWFVAFIFINTLGILEIVYLFFVRKISYKQLFTSTQHSSADVMRV